jgi:hypothetical protein
MACRICDEAKSREKEGVPGFEKEIKMFEQEELPLRCEGLTLRADDAVEHFNGIDVCFLGLFPARPPKPRADAVAVHIHGKRRSDFDALPDGKSMITRAQIEKGTKGLEVTSDPIFVVHHSLPARPRFAKFGFSQRFCKILYGVIVPGEVDEILHDDDFDLFLRRAFLFYVIEHIRPKKIDDARCARNKSKNASSRPSEEGRDSPLPDEFSWTPPFNGVTAFQDFSESPPAELEASYAPEGGSGTKPFLERLVRGRRLFVIYLWGKPQP